MMYLLLITKPKVIKIVYAHIKFMRQKIPQKEYLIQSFHKTNETAWSSCMIICIFCKGV